MTRIASTLAMVVTLTIAVATCRHFQYEAHPLYEGEPRPTADVAKLSGPVAKVDGMDVSHLGSLFALLPGCHVVELPTTLGQGTSTGAWSATIGHVSYAFAMKPGHLYVIETHTLPGNAASVGNAVVGGVKVTAVERDSDGNLVAKLAQVRSRADVEKCRTEDDKLRAQQKPAVRPDVARPLPPPPVSAPTTGPMSPMDAGAETTP